MRSATRMGFERESVDLIALLVRWHLLLAETATSRDPDDPATVERVTSRVGSAEALALLGALTEADAKATSPKAWSSWRSGLIRRPRPARPRGARQRRSRCRRSRPTRSSCPPTCGPTRSPSRSSRSPTAVAITTIAVDRIGLLADFAAMLALQRLQIRAARVWAQGEHGVSVWEVASDDVDPTILRTKYDAIVGGRLDPGARFAPAAPTDGLAPSVVVRPEASEQATVLEVRAADRPGVVYLVCAALAGLDVAVRSAHVDTLGPQAVDVFYLQEPSAGALSETRAAQAAHAVRDALTG